MSEYPPPLWLYPINWLILLITYIKRVVNHPVTSYVAIPILMGVLTADTLVSDPVLLWGLIPLLIFTFIRNDRCRRLEQRLRDSPLSSVNLNKLHSEIINHPDYVSPTIPWPRK